MQQGKPLSFLSKSLGKKSAELSTYDKEAMAIIEALKKWKRYLSEGELILRTDQQRLKYMGEQRLVQGIQHELLVKLMGYNYKIEYKKAKKIELLMQCLASLKKINSIPYRLLYHFGLHMSYQAIQMILSAKRITTKNQ
jgi:hypothetical protein